MNNWKAYAMPTPSDKIDAILPQTQCTKCGFDDCRAYANAIATGSPHNQCPPGGKRVIGELSELLGRPVLSLNSKHGHHEPKKVAVIREAECIGCTKCIQACPVDAIFGAAKLMHSVIATECTGCDLCVEPCPMDCIDLIALPEAEQPDAMPAERRLEQSDHYRKRHETQTSRMQRLEQEAQQRHKENKAPLDARKLDSREQKKAYIAEAMARVRQKKS